MDQQVTPVDPARRDGHMQGVLEPDLSRMWTANRQPTTQPTTSCCHPTYSDTGARTTSPDVAFSGFRQTQSITKPNNTRVAALLIALPALRRPCACVDDVRGRLNPPIHGRHGHGRDVDLGMRSKTDVCWAVAAPHDDVGDTAVRSLGSGRTGRPPGPRAPPGPRPLCSASRVALLRSASWIAPFLICFDVITLAATALPVLATTTAVTAMTSEGEGRRCLGRFMVAPCPSRAGCIAGPPVVVPWNSRRAPCSGPRRGGSRGDRRPATH